MANLSWFSLALLLFFHMSRAIHTNNNKNKHNGLSSRLINLESLDSSLYRSNLTVEGKTERLVRSFEFRLGRVKSPKSLSHGNYSLSQLKRQHSNITRLSIYQFYQGIYLVQVGIGKFRGSRPPFKSYYLVLDTGSGPIWTQCQGCNSCFSQRDPVFPMDRSLTYRASPCNQCPSSTSCVQNHCTLNYTYVDGTQIHGISASEKFMFVPNNAVFFATTWSLRFLCVVRSEKVAFGKTISNFDLLRLRLQIPG
ncbi:hypothetical protein RND81_06G212200 [Saponaria officinalis]|uniref:Peptidase A1 domain-containing protein n=1 Tax=Saponaria officinalis TaxID=3572 RepID=A0AAW1KCB7_SAPOF